MSGPFQPVHRALATATAFVACGLLAAAALASACLPALADTAPSPTGPAAANPVASAVASPDVDDTIGGPRLAAGGFVVDTDSGIPALPPTTATSFVVADAATGEILAAHNVHERLAPASTLKTLTALTLLPQLKPSAPVVPGSDAPAVDGTKAGIVAGTTYTVANLFTAMLMMSANDAAVALADANGGLDPTLAQMNAVAARLQADDTVAKTPDGLDAAGQSSSAYDLALIFRAGLSNPQFVHYLSMTSAAFPAPGGATFQIQTHDELLTRYPGMVGGKNGYTVAAQASYVGAASRGGKTVIVALMRDRADFWPEAQALLDWGFAADGIAASMGQLVDPLGAASPSASASSSASSPSSSPTSVTTTAAVASANPAANPAASPAAGATDAVAGLVGGSKADAGQRSRGGGGVSLALVGAAAGGVVIIAGGLIALRVRARRRQLRYRRQRFLSNLSRL